MIISDHTHQEPLVSETKPIAPLRAVASLWLVISLGCGTSPGDASALQGGDPSESEPARPPTTRDDSGSKHLRAPTVPPQVGSAEFGLRSLAAADFANRLREQAIEQMDEQIDKQIGELSKQLSNAAGEAFAPCFFAYDVLATAGPVAAPSPNAGAAVAESAPEATSGTNNQVVGVEEADFVKNDGQHIYVLGADDLRIFDAWPAEEAHLVARVMLEGHPRKMFVHGDRLLVYASLGRRGGGETDSAVWRGWWGRSRRTECTYGYNCDFTGDGNPTSIRIYDISDRASPALLRTIHLAGSLIQARRVGTAVYTVVSTPPVPFPVVYDPPCGYCGRCDKTPEQIEAHYASLREKNLAAIRQMDLSPYLPRVEEHGVRGSVTSSSMLSRYFWAPIADGAQFTTLVSLDMKDEQKNVTAATIASRPGAVYASAEALYLSVPHQRNRRWAWFGAAYAEQKEASTVHRFSLDPDSASARYTGSGVVKGRVLNQFSMDEFEGHLRIATTSGRVPDPKVHSTLSVLRPEDGDLLTVGLVDQLAPGEDIRSVRFDRKRAFVVTFKKTDPLFVFDLSRPTNPEVLAELKIPGFSTYMHMIDDDHLLSVGYDADDQGSFAYFTGVMLQLFDVSDPRNPVRTHREVIGTRGSSSEALTNHLAFTYFAPRNALALPITVCDGASGDGRYGQNMSFSGLKVYEVSTETGFSLKGGVSHPAAAGITCSNWWTNASSQVRRSIFMDDYVYSISSNLLKVNHVERLSADLEVLPLSDAPR
jgi:uncharacterized secreted protein with C-terminal beta-propeller domain